MAKSTSQYYKTLADLNGHAKFDALDALDFGRQLYKDLIEPHKGLVSLIKSLAPITEKITWLREIQETQQAISQYLNDILQLSQGIHSLPSEGWYFSLQFIDSLAVFNLQEYLQKDPAAFETDVLNIFDKQLNTIEKKLTAAFPKRAHILSNIFKHHREGDYNASIVLALTQAMGSPKKYSPSKTKTEIPSPSASLT